MGEVRKQFPNGTTMAELQQHFVDNMMNDCATCVATVKDYDLPLIQKKQREAQRAEEAKRLKEEDYKEEDDKKESSPSPSVDSEPKTDDSETVVASNYRCVIS